MFKEGGARGIREWVFSSMKWILSCNNCKFNTVEGCKKPHSIECSDNWVPSRCLEVLEEVE